MRRTAVFLLLLAAALSCWAGFPTRQRPVRPVTDLRCVRDGNDVVLNWTTLPTGTYRYIVCRGVMQPLFRAEKIVAILPVGTLAWRDYGAITRTVNGVWVNEFYRVYALPGLVPPPGMAPKTTHNEYRERPRNLQQVLRFDVSNGAQFNIFPVAGVVGRDDSWSIPAARSSSTAFLFDILNLPTPAAVAGGTIWISGEPVEEKPGTWLHAGYYAMVFHVATGSNEIVTSASAREMEAPAVSRNGNVVTVTTTEPPQDTAGILTGIKWYRSHKGVGGTETMTLLATTPVTTLEIQDDITNVTANWYVFYTYKLAYLGGDSSWSASSVPVRR